MPTARAFARNAFRAGLYEAQDVLVEADEVDLIRLEPSQGFRFRNGWLRRLLYHDISGTLAFANPGLRKVRLNHDYELFVAICQFYWDIPYINAIEDWKDHCKTSVCWIDELWAAAIPAFKRFLHVLRQFDYVFVGQSGSVAPLSNAIGRPVFWLPGGVDAVRFTPYPSPAARVIDVYSIGRRWNGIHQALLQAAARKEIFYIHDTFQAADTEVYDHSQHRNLFANVAKRSRYFMVAPGKIDDKVTQGQIEIGYRYYEGAAAGTVMLGQPPSCPSFQQMFPWQDAVIHVQPDGSDAMDVLAALRSEPERVETLGRKNATEALLRHDWIYRWKEVFRVAGLPSSPGMLARERRLAELADLAGAAAKDKSFADSIS